MPAHDKGPPPRRGARHPKGSAGPRPEAKVAMNLRLPPETIRRLKVHSLAEGRSASEIVADLIETHLRRHTLAPDESRDD